MKVINNKNNICFILIIVLFLSNFQFVFAKNKVDNSAPRSQVTAEILRNKKLNLNVITDYSGQKLLNLNSKLSNFKVDMFSKYVDSNINIVSEPKTIDHYYPRYTRIMDTSYDYIKADGTIQGVGFNTKEYFKDPIAYSYCSGYYVVLTENGELYGWGSNNFGQIPTVLNESHIDRPRKYPVSNVKKFLMYKDFIVILKEDGEMLVCGMEVYTPYINSGSGDNPLLGPFTEDSDVIDIIKSKDQKNLFYIKNNGDVYCKGQYTDIVPSGVDWDWSGTSEIGYIPVIHFEQKIPNIKANKVQVTKNRSYFIDSNKNEVYICTKHKLEKFNLNGFNAEDIKKIVGTSDTDYYLMKNGDLYKKVFGYYGTDIEKLNDIGFTYYYREGGRRGEVKHKYVTLTTFNNDVFDIETIGEHGWEVRILKKDYKVYSQYNDGRIYDYEGDDYPYNKKRINDVDIDYDLGKVNIYNMDFQKAATEFPTKTSESNEIFLLLTDGVGQDYTRDFGGYYSLRTLSTAFCNYTNQFQKYIICPSKILDYKENGQVSSIRNLNGKFVDSGGNGLTKLDTILEEIKSKYSSPKIVDTKYILKTDKVNFISNANDLENDKIIQANWVFKHEENYFQNSEGKLKNADIPINTPITSFNKVGKYEINSRAKDSAGTSDDRFKNYRKWSNNSALELYVHRKPKALFTIEKNGLNLIYVNKSLDLDHTNLSNRGIAQIEWSWKYEDEYTYRISFPPTTIQSKVFDIRLRVKDIEGVWSDYYTLSSKDTIDTIQVNNPPTALFTLSQYEIIKGTNITGVDSSFDIDNDPLSKNWKIYNSGAAVYNSSIMPNSTTFKNLATGDYKILLTVTDNPTARNPKLKPLTDQYEATLRVLNAPINNPPVADLLIEKNKILEGQTSKTQTYSYDIDGDKIIQEAWAYKKIGVHNWVYSSTQKDIKTLDEGEYQFAYRVKDEKGAWSNWAYDNLTILPNNTKPSANFSINPIKILEDDSFNIIDNSNPNDNWDKIILHHWQYKKDDGSWSMLYNKPITKVYGNGTFTIRHKVLDSGNELSKGLWSDWYERTIEVLPRNTQPFVNFKIPSTVFSGEEINYLNYYETANDDWDSIIKRKWSYSKDKGITWIEVSQPTKFLESGTYLIKVSVLDRGNELSSGMWSQPCIRSINIVDKPNHKPVALFEVNPNPQLEGETFTITDNSYDLDEGDYITERKWRTYNTKTAAWSDESNTKPNKFNVFGTYIIAERVKDTGNNTYGPLWSDYHYETIDILPINHKPIADFIAIPEVQVANHPIQFEDKSKTGENLEPEKDWDKIIKWEWSYRKKGTSTWNKFSTIQNPTLTLPTEGFYEIRLKVQDKGNQLSSSLWSDYCIKEVQIIDLSMTASLSPNPAKQGQQITFTVKTEGNAEHLKIIFPNDIYVLDPKNLPINKSIKVEPIHTEFIKYYLPLETPLTINDDRIRIKSYYEIIVESTKGNIKRSVKLQLDVKGNILDSIKTEIKN